MSRPRREDVVEAVRRDFSEMEAPEVLQILHRCTASCGHLRYLRAEVMSIVRISMLVLAVWLASVGASGAQVPDDIRGAMRARDTAFYAVDPAQWEQYTAPTFTTVQQDGSFMTRPERLANLRTQTPRPYVPRSRERHERRGDLVVARFFSGGFWVLEVWTRETGRWMVLMSQVTTAKP